MIAHQIKIIKYHRTADQHQGPIHSRSHAGTAPPGTVSNRCAYHLPDHDIMSHVRALADLGGRHRTCASYRDSSQDLSLSLKSHQLHHRRIVCSSCLSPLSSLPRVRPAFNAHAYDICALYGSTLAQVPRCAALPRAPLNRRRSCAPRSRVRAPPTKLPLRRLSQSPPPPPPRPSPRVW